MSVLQKTAHFQGRRDEAPNVELAESLAAAKDRAGIAEIAENLWNRNANIQADCLKVLYEIGALDPGLIADYAKDFLRLLGSKNNRLVWGSMTALAAIAPLRAGLLCRHFGDIRAAMQSGSVITRDQGVRVMAALASSSGGCSAQAFDSLLEHLKACRVKDIPQHAESAVLAVGPRRRDAFVAVLEARREELSPAQLKRVKKVVASLQE